MQGRHSRRLVVVLIGAACEGGLGLLAWALGLLFGHSPLAHFTVSSGALVAGMAATMPMLLVFLATNRWPIGPLERIRRFFDEAVRPLLQHCTLGELALLSLAAGVGEEMLFRGFLQDALAATLGPWPGLLLTSLLFGLLHPITGTYILLAALLGLYLGSVYNVSGNLVTVIITHTVYDFVVLVYLLRGPGRLS